MSRLSSKSLRISLSVLDMPAYVVRLEQFPQRQTSSQHTHQRKINSWQNWTGFMLRVKVFTRPTGRQGEKMFKVTFNCSHVSRFYRVISQQPNQKSFLGHFPGLHSWIRENLGVLGEPGGGQYQSRTAPGHEESLALGWWGPQKELWFLRWHPLFCFAGSHPPTHTPRRKENGKMALTGTEFQLGRCRRIATNSRPVCSAQSRDTQSYKGDLVSTSKK